MDLSQPLPITFDPLLKPLEAAHYLGISKATLNKWRTKRRSSPRAFKIGSTLRYRISDLDEWLNRHREFDDDQEPSPFLCGPDVIRGGPPARLTLVTLQNYWFHVLHRDPLLTVDEAAQYLAIPKATIYTHRTRRPDWGPSATEVGGLLRYRLSALNEWVERHLEPEDQERLAG
jgi:excisionase family DNA binding protein